ncbi:hypothetical protein NIES4101_84210 [Calothrix sp. NIES-4101]|nr:hypothetical protein NIES4101_84210 [Calothrix sp. NIES-4101]
MFLDELTPIFKQFAQHPASFMGGFVSGALKLSLADDPVKSWLNQQLGVNTNSANNSDTQNGRTSGPQSISID